MSHFTVLVIGDDVEGQLAPYSEHIEVDPYVEDCWCTGREDLPEDFECDDCKGTGKETTTYNPNSKWNWYMTGGRWRGYFKLKAGKEAIDVGGSGVFGNAPVHDADVALAGDIDWERMVNENKKSAEKTWEKAQEENRDVRYKLLVCGIREDDTKESYIKRCSYPCTFAVVKDGEWYEQGSIGPFAFGFAKDELDPTNWAEIWWKLVYDLPPDTKLTLLDCHI